MFVLDGVANVDGRESSFREQMLQQVFISEVFQEVWLRHRKTIKLHRPEGDSSGYDLVLEHDHIVRHVQLKSSRADSPTVRLTVSAELSEKASGCVVWLVYKVRPEVCRVDLAYRFFGSDPGKPLPSLEKYEVANHFRGKAKNVRPRLRVVPKADFSPEMDLGQLMVKLFGPGFGPRP